MAQGTVTAEQLEGPFANDTLQRLIDEARAGMVYGDVHSTRFPGGAARLHGQLLTRPGQDAPMAATGARSRPRLGFSMAAATLTKF